MKKGNNDGFKVFLNRWSVGFLSLAATIAGIGGYLVALDHVTLIVDGHKSAWKTHSATVAKVLKEKKIVLRSGDQIEPAADTKITEGMVVRVKRAFAVHIQTMDQNTVYRTTAQPVEMVLKQAGIGYDGDDKISPALEQVVQPNQTIRVIQVVSKVVKQQAELKAGVEYQRAAELERGTRRLVRQGAPGIVETQLKVVYEDGKIVDRQKITERVVKPMTNTIIALGIKPLFNTLVTSRGSYRYRDLKHMVATAYSPGPESCGKYAAVGRTYTGKKAGYGLVAVDPRVIRLGTMLYVEGYGKAEAADIGKAIKGERIDLCFETYREAAMFGRKKLKVYILEH
jgi:uncharacterized protein YabE (DUF348 family)